MDQTVDSYRGSDLIELFIRALRRFESTRFIDALVVLFSEEAELADVQMLSTVKGKAGVYRYWRAYLASYDSIRTNFERVNISNTSATLEWVSTGELLSGRPFRIKGVTVIDIGESGITRLHRYYNSAALSEEHLSKTSFLP